MNATLKPIFRATGVLDIHEADSEASKSEHCKSTFMVVGQRGVGLGIGPPEAGGGGKDRVDSLIEKGPERE